MSQKPWPQNGCLSGMEVSHHPDNQVQPSEYHQCVQQCQGSGFTAPRDLSVELICCSGNRIFFFFFAQWFREQTDIGDISCLEWLTGRVTARDAAGTVLLSQRNSSRIRVIFCVMWLIVTACMPRARTRLKLDLHMRGAHGHNMCDVVRELAFVRALLFLPGSESVEERSCQRGWCARLPTLAGPRPPMSNVTALIPYRCSSGITARGGRADTPHCSGDSQNQ